MDNDTEVYIGNIFLCKRIAFDLILFTAFRLPLNWFTVFRTV